MTPQYPKRLIEVDLPIKRISAHARREKDMRRGHIPLIHIYPAARPPAACRAVMCAALWPDPADENCSVHFRDAACGAINRFAEKATTNRDLGSRCDSETWIKWQTICKSGGLQSHRPDHWNVLRFALLDFIADFANWDNSTDPDYLATARELTKAAQISLSQHGSSEWPIIVDSFAGGGAIPLEGTRLWCDVFASDSSPVAILLNKICVEILPMFGEELVLELENSIRTISNSLREDLAALYPVDPDGQIPIAFLWARTIRCEGPACGAVVPLVRSTQIVRKGKRSLFLRLAPAKNRKSVDVSIADERSKTDSSGTIRRGAANCPVCGYTTPVESVRRQLLAKHGGADDAQLLAVATVKPGSPGRLYRTPHARDLEASHRATEELRRLSTSSAFADQIPTEEIPVTEIRRISIPLYGLTRWSDLFTPRQLVTLSTISSLIRREGARLRAEKGENFGAAAQACLSLLLDKIADMNTSLCVWQSHAEIPAHIFGRWAIGMVFDFAETNPLAQSSGSPEASGRRFLDGLRVVLAASGKSGRAELADATSHPLPDSSVQLFMVDPPYYDAIPYAHLMDFFYVWLKRTIGEVFPSLFRDELIDKAPEIVVDRPHNLSNSHKDVAFYERELQRAFADGRRILEANGVGVVVFASKTTSSWEAILQAIVNSGWVITGSWPIDTEMESRVAAQGQARLGSSVHIVCRPREGVADQSRELEVGDWRDILHELPQRIHDWMPRLAAEGIVGADAIFACLGPALEIFSRYSRVEKASGEAVMLREYLEHVWAAVAKEALTQVFKGADATGFEPDARLTAMWLWTLNAPTSNGAVPNVGEEDLDDGEPEVNRSKAGGFTLEYDAARKIAQGLGAVLENLTHLVEVKGDDARLLPVAERTRHLFGKDEEEATKPVRKKAVAQMNMFAELAGSDNTEAAWQEKTVKRIGETALDRVHQAMILFAAGRGEALKRFIVDDGVGNDGKFWRLAQALSALYPTGTDERRWVEGVMARKKQFGF